MHKHQALTLDLDLRPSPKCCTRVFMTLEMSNNPFFIKLDYLNESGSDALNKCKSDFFEQMGLFCSKWTLG
jgi:hypothetical protein